MKDTLENPRACLRKYGNIVWGLHIGDELYWNQAKIMLGLWQVHGRKYSPAYEFGKRAKAKYGGGAYGLPTIPVPEMNRRLPTLGWDDPEHIRSGSGSEYS